jgi:hypothetical protein
MWPTHSLLRRIGRLVARINPLQRLANRTFCANLSDEFDRSQI